MPSYTKVDSPWQKGVSNVLMSQTEKCLDEGGVEALMSSLQCSVSVCVSVCECERDCKTFLSSKITSSVED